MIIESTRFGPFEIEDDKLLVFSDGLIGLPGTRYALVAREEQAPFYWLHSAERPEIAVPVTNPWLFYGDYEVSVPDDDAAALGIQSPDQAEILCIVRATADLADFSVNLAAPVVIHSQTKAGRQIINDARGYSVRHPLFSEVELDEAQTAAARMKVEVAVT